MQWLRKFWKRFWSWLRHKPLPLATVRCSEVPENIDPTKMYLVGEGQYLWFAAFACPCGCGELVQLSLLADSRPRWRVEEHGDGTASLHPSVWRKRGCRSHFFVKRGLIVWSTDSR